MTGLPTLIGSRCRLRDFDEADAGALQRHADDPEVAYNLFDDFPQPYTLADALAWCGPLHREPQFGLVWGIEVRDEIAGCISVTPQRGLWAASAVVGYWLGRAWWRRGIVSEALGLVTAWSWTHLPATDRLWMPIYARNLGSRRVALRAGYVQEGYMPCSIRKSGESIDGVAYGAYRPGLALHADPGVP